MKKNTFFHIDGTIAGLLSICALATLAFSLAMPGRFFSENTFLVSHSSCQSWGC